MLEKGSRGRTAPSLFGVTAADTEMTLHRKDLAMKRGARLVHPCAAPRSHAHATLGRSDVRHAERLGGLQTIVAAAGQQIQHADADDQTEQAGTLDRRRHAFGSANERTRTNAAGNRAASI